LAYVPADFKKTVVFLGQDVCDNTHVWASAFWVINVQSPEELAKQYHPAYLVTATHALERLERKGISTVRIRVNLKTGQSQWLPPISIARWKAHPDSTVDVSFLKHEIRQEWDHEGWPTTAFVTANSIKEDHKEIELGDEVFSVGLFWPHEGKMRNVPVVRVGNIAALRDERVETTEDVFSDVYLMESRSVGGLSGAPVFIDIVRARLTGKEISRLGNPTMGPFRFRLIGAISGHFKGTDDELASTGLQPKELDKLNMGIAYMTPAEKVLDGLRLFKAEEEEESRHLRDGTPLSIKVGDSSPRTNVSSQVVSVELSDIGREKK
jgi:hypothetical protein